MPSAIRTHNLRPLHAERAIHVPRHSTRDGIEERRPAAARLELLVRLVERSVAAGAGVDARGGHVLVIFARVGSFGALLAKDAELL